jgi:uracil-DNA glycosylase
MLERFAFAAVAKCYPGRLPGGRGDRAPDRGERERCRPWTDALVRLCDPAVVVPVGRLAIDDWLGPAPLAEVVGRRFERDGRVIVPLPHPSGASAWANGAANRALIEQAVAQLRDTLL